MTPGFYLTRADAEWVHGESSDDWPENQRRIGGGEKKA